MSDTMRVLSFHEPWATLASFGEKRIETRSWKTKYRGRIYLHSTQAFPAYAKEYLEDSRFRKALRRNGHGFETENFALGSIVGVADLVGCLKTEGIRSVFRQRQDAKLIAATFEFEGALVQKPQKYEPIKVQILDIDDELCFGDYSPNRYGFFLANARRFRWPVPAKGFQRIWRITDEATRRAVEEQEELFLRL